MLRYLSVLLIVIVLLKESYGQEKSLQRLPPICSGELTEKLFPYSTTGKQVLSSITGEQQLNDAVGKLLPELVDTIGKQLPEVIVRAFEQNRPLKEVAAPVAVIGSTELGRYNQSSLVPAVNSAPGVRMEERSPGSYRLNIRGSSLRSPFGVRNVKIYLNGVPFTDAGGNTYLNQLSFFDVTGMEIIKGPGSSLYGAGTGGVMLLRSLPETTKPDASDSASRHSGLEGHFSHGSYQSYTGNLSARFGTKAVQNKVSYTHQQSDGYRNHSYMRRDIASWQTLIRANENQSLTAYMLYGDLYYETPGGLTKEQYQQNPRAARPAGNFPGAVENKASISQKTYWMGLQQEYRINRHWENHTAVYGAFSQIKNPAILNYERRSDPHFGGRTSLSFHTSLPAAELKLIAGAEFQQGFSSVKVYQNNGGIPGVQQTDDEVNSRTGSVFLQGELSFARGWIATAGLSASKNAVRFTRLSETPPFDYQTRFYNEWAPRLSLLKKLNPRLSVYGVVSKGFSPPTVAELLPSTSVINTSLEAERGINYEAGMRGSFFRNRLKADISGYYFGLNKAITQRRDQSGADYFVNAGSTRQQGIETSLAYRFILPDGKFLTGCTVWLSHAYTHYRYHKFQKDADDFSGNTLPGVAPHSVAGGIDLNTKPGLFASLTWFYSDAVALNDANTAFAGSYQIPGFRAGYRITGDRQLSTELFISGDNLFDQQYSLGYDINAAGGRYYNAAPGINFQAGIKIGVR